MWGGHRMLGGLVAATMLAVAAPAAAEITDGIVRIGVLGDQSVIPDVAGAGAVIAARMAAEDHGNKAGGKPIEIIQADFQLKPDLAASIARRWFDQEGVDAIADLPSSAGALAVQELARERKKTLLIAGAVTAELTGKACSPTTTVWSDNSSALARGASRITREGGKNWFFMSADNALGASIERDATSAITEAGGKVVGGVKHPLIVTDYSSFLLQAQASGAQVIGIAGAVGQVLKQAHDFRIVQSGQTLAGFLVFINEIHGVGLEAAQGLLVTTSFYWDESDRTRAFGRRFLAATGRMPTKEQAATYASVDHYLKAVDATGSDDATIVNARMREMPVDYFGRTYRIGASGRVLFDFAQYVVKSPSESQGAWDLYRRVGVIPAEDAFQLGGPSACPLPEPPAR